MKNRFVAGLKYTKTDFSPTMISQADQQRPKMPSRWANSLPFPKLRHLDLFGPDVDEFLLGVSSEEPSAAERDWWLDLDRSAVVAPQLALAAVAARLVHGRWNWSGKTRCRPTRASGAQGCGEARCAVANFAAAHRCGEDAQGRCQSQSAQERNEKASMYAKVGHPFRVIKRQFVLPKVKLKGLGLANNTAHVITLFAISNCRWGAKVDCNVEDRCVRKQHEGAGRGKELIDSCDSSPCASLVTRQLVACSDLLSATLPGTWTNVGPLNSRS